MTTTTIRKIAAADRHLWDVIESLPTKTVKGGKVDIHLCRQSGGGPGWETFAMVVEQYRDDLPGAPVVKVFPGKDEAAARAQFESMRNK